MRQDIGEWADNDRVAQGRSASVPTTGSRPPLDVAIASLDVKASVHDAVRAVMRSRVETIAASAVDTLLDESARAQLRAAADIAARAALNEPPPLLEDTRPELYYPDVVAFVTKQLIPMYRRPLGGHGVTWCPEWWRHAEAIARLEALWRAWEHLRLDAATGMSVWFRDHADHHMTALLSADGPFKGCKPKEGHGDRLEAFPLIPPPGELFTAS